MKAKSIGRLILTYLGYGSFFVVAFVAFVYLTLPLDTLKAYLIRKVADEQHADLVIEDLTTWGLTGLSATNVTYTPRPSPEEAADLAAARELRKAWQDTHRGARAKSEEKASGIDAGAPGTTSVAQDDGPKPGKSDSAEGDEAPSVPSGPQAMEFAMLRAKAGLVDLLRGRRSGALEAELLGGTVEAEVRQVGEDLSLDGKWSGLELRQLTMLKRQTGVALAGTFEGAVDVGVPMGDDGKLRLASATGTIELRVANGALGPGKIESAKAGAVEIPMAAFTELNAKFVLEKKRATVDHFDLIGKDLEAELTGYIQLANALKQFAPRLHLRFKLGEEFQEAHTDLKVLLSMGPLKAGQSEGYTGLAINGTFEKIDAKPRRDSPYKRGSAAADATPAPKDEKKTTPKADRKGGKSTARPVGKTTGGLPTPRDRTNAAVKIEAPIPVERATEAEPVAAPEPPPVADPVEEAAPPVPEPEVEAAETEKPEGEGPDEKTEERDDALEE